MRNEDTGSSVDRTLPAESPGNAAPIMEQMENDAYAAAAHQASIGNDVMTFDRSIDSCFTIVPNELTDSRSPYHVNHAAAGCWMHMKALGRGWRFNVKGFVTICDDGESKIQSQLKALEAKGWVLCFRRRERGRWAAGGVWHVLDDPRRAKAQVELYESLGLTLYSKLETVIEKPQVKTASRIQRYGSDQGIVENLSAEENPLVENSADGLGFSKKAQQNTRSQPYLEKPYLENRPLFNKLNNKKLNEQSSPMPCRDAFARIVAMSPTRIRKSVENKVKRAFAILTDSVDLEPARIADAWEAYILAYCKDDDTDFKQIESELLAFLSNRALVIGWAERAASSKTESAVDAGVP